jgi:hypothetical protein
LDRQAAADLQAARITGTSELQQDQFDEALLERTSREREAGLNRDLARAELRGFEEIDGRRVQTLAAREAGAQRRLTASESALERGARADLQQAQFGQETSQADLQRALAREEMYGRAMTEAEAQAGRYGGGTLARTGQEADIAAENRRLAEMETAGISQRGLAERELTQRATLASEQRALDREQLYGRAMTREEQMSGLGYSGGTLGAQQQAEIERAALISEGFEGRRVGVSEQARRDQVAQERQRMALAEQELYGGAEEISLDSLELDPDIEMGAGRSAAIEMALQQRLGRKPSRDEIASVTGGNSIRGRQTLAAQEAGEGRAFAAEQAALDRGLTRGESGLARELSREELAQRGTLAEADITSRERMAQEQRLLSREELYGTGDISAQQGSTLAAKQARQDLALRGELGRGQLEQDTRRTDLARDELRGYAELPSGYREETVGAREARLGRGLEGRRLAEVERAGAAATDQAINDLALRGELGRGQLGLSQTELYGQDVSDMSPNQIRALGGTLGAREAREGRALEGRRLSEIERAGAAGTEAEKQRLRLASEELYGGAGVDPRMGTLASREAVSDRALRRQLGEGQLEQDTRRTDLARDELRGYSELYPGGMREDTAAVREGKAARGLEGRRMDEIERSALVSEQADRDRLGLAEEELYGGVGRRGMAGTTLASREAEAGRDFESGERALDRKEASNQASQARLLAREELYGTSDPYSQTGETLQGRLASEETSRYNAATTLEAERYETQRGDYAADIRRRDEQDELQKQFEGLAAGRAMDAARLADSNYEASPQEQAVVDYLLRGGKGEIQQYLTKSQVDALRSRGFTEDEIYAIEGGADPKGILAARE